jgi:NDP-sugar pyrophosphorylase family protein
MPNLLERQIKQGEKINAFPIHEYWLDIGRIEEYEQARKYYSREF